MTEQPIFVVGCPRSGTTVLGDLLRSHSRLTFPRESCGLPGLYRTHGDPRSDREARRLAADFLGSHAVADWNLGLPPAEPSRGRSARASGSAGRREIARLSCTGGRPRGT